jgi:hypothetical protein
MKSLSATKFNGLLLSIPFFVIYFVVRSLPVEQCDFLHEETYNLEGELDYCGPGDDGFVDLSIRRWPMSLDFRPLDPLEIGKPCRFEMNIKQADGSPLGKKDVALSHTKRIHLLAIDPTMDDYQHLHPEPDPLFNGIWRFTLTPQKAGEYKVYLDLIPLRSPRRVLLAAQFEVPGESGVAQSSESSLIVQKGDREFLLGASIVGGSKDDWLLTFSALDKNGKDLPLKPVMGAFAHLVAFEPNTAGFAHLHPLEYEPPKSKKDSRIGPLSFSFKSPAPGNYRLWAQIKVGQDEEETFLPFDLKI